MRLKLGVENSTNLWFHSYSKGRELNAMILSNITWVSSFQSNKL